MIKALYLWIKNKLSKAFIGLITLIIGILIFLFGLRSHETCMITAIIGGIIFLVGLWLFFQQPKTCEMK